MPHKFPVPASLDQVRAYLKRAPVCGELCQEAPEHKAAWIRDALTALRYERLPRDAKGDVRTYLQHVTGYSRAQITRHIGSTRSETTDHDAFTSATAATIDAEEILHELRSLIHEERPAKGESLRMASDVSAPVTSPVQPAEIAAPVLASVPQSAPARRIPRLVFMTVASVLIFLGTLSLFDRIGTSVTATLRGTATEEMMEEKDVSLPTLCADWLSRTRILTQLDVPQKEGDAELREACQRILTDDVRATAERIRALLPRTSDFPPSYP